MQETIVQGCGIEPDQLALAVSPAGLAELPQAEALAPFAPGTGGNVPKSGIGGNEGMPFGAPVGTAGCGAGVSIG
jgi:hypothetical protein